MEVKHLKRQVEGIVIKAISGFFTVAGETGEVVAQLPGRLKQEWQKSTLVAVGDRVTVALNEDGDGTVTAVAERHTVLSRTRTSAEGRRLLQDEEQVLVANPDQVLFVVAVKRPHPSLRKLDRFLVVAEMNGLPAVICVNKIDLTGLKKARAIFRLYEDLGYPVIYTSAIDGTGVAELRDCLVGKLSVLAGSSGVGKSSLLNAIQPDLGLKVRAVSQASGKGVHTTRFAQLFPLIDGGYVADTPGIRGLALYDVEPAELDAYFREIAPLVTDCRFSNCSHQHEPGCAVRRAVADGRIARARYDSYLRLRQEHEALDRAAY